MFSLAKRLRAVLHRLEYKRWPKRKYLVGQKHAMLYRFKGTYQFVAEHQNECGCLCEDSKVVILPDSISELEFVRNLKAALENSNAVDSQSVEYDRLKYLKAHRAKSYKEFYGHSKALSVAYDANKQVISVLSWKSAPDRGQVPVADSKQILDANNTASWLHIKSMLDEDVVLL